MSEREPNSEHPNPEHRARRLLSGGSFGLLIGIALSALGQGPMGGWVAVVAAGALVVGLHTFGRLGPDVPKVATTSKKKKKRKHKSNTED